MTIKVRSLGTAHFVAVVSEGLPFVEVPPHELNVARDKAAMAKRERLGKLIELRLWLFPGTYEPESG
jgi:hypothetical protein